MVATIRLTNGAIGTLSVSSSVRGTRHDELRVWGTGGHVEAIPSLRAFPLRVTEPLAAARWNAMDTAPVNIRAAYFSRLATCLETTGEVEVGLDAGLHVQATIDAVYRATERGIMVRPLELLLDE